MQEKEFDVEIYREEGDKMAERIMEKYFRKDFARKGVNEKGRDVYKMGELDSNR